METWIRLFYIFAPAILWSLVLAHFDSDFALIIFFMQVYMGYELTKSEPSRGEKFIA